MVAGIYRKRVLNIHKKGILNADYQILDDYMLSLGERSLRDLLQTYDEKLVR